MPEVYGHFWRISLTSADSLRLWLVAGLSGDRKSATQSQLLPPAQAARTEATVTYSLLDGQVDGIEEHVGTVYRYAMRLAGRTDVAEDLTQEAMLHAWRGRDKLRDPQVARVWLLRIVTNVWNDHLRQARFRPRTLETEPPCTHRALADVMDGREAVAQAMAVMDELPTRQKQVIYLVTCEGLSHAEVAEILEISLTAVKSNLSMARKEMRRRLKDIYDEVCGRTQLPRS